MNVMILQGGMKKMFGFKRKRKPQRATIEQPTQPTAEVTPIEANVRDTILTNLLIRVKSKSKKMEFEKRV